MDEVASTRFDVVSMRPARDSEPPDDPAVLPVGGVDDAGVDDAGVADAGVADAPFVDAVAFALPHVQRIALLLTNDPDVADDVVAEAVARALPRWRSGDIDDPPAYLRRIVVNLVSRRWKRRALGRRRDHRALDWLPRDRDAPAELGERDRTLRALASLPPRRRAVVVLRFYDDLSEADIADVLGISVGTVKSQLSRALEQLRAELGAQVGS